MAHLIWDWNGTLFDDAWLCVEIINRLLTDRGLPRVDADGYQRTFTFPVESYYRAVGFDLTQEPFEHLSREYMEEYDRRHRECRLQPGARGVLATLSARGCTHSLLSATEQSRLEAMVRHADLREQFDHLVGLGDYYARSKADQGRDLLSRLPCLPAEVMLVGDTLHDYEVASALGIECSLLPSGHCSRARLASSGAQVLDRLSDLLTPSALFLGRSG